MWEKLQVVCRILLAIRLFSRRVATMKYESKLLALFSYHKELQNKVSKNVSNIKQMVLKGRNCKSTLRDWFLRGKTTPLLYTRQQHRWMK